MLHSLEGVQEDPRHPAGDVAVLYRVRMMRLPQLGRVSRLALCPVELRRIERASGRSGYTGRRSRRPCDRKHRAVSADHRADAVADTEMAIIGRRPARHLHLRVPSEQGVDESSDSARLRAGKESCRVLGEGRRMESFRVQTEC